MANPHHQSGPHQRAPNINPNQTPGAGTNSNNNHSRYNNNYNNHPRANYQTNNMYAQQMPNLPYTQYIQNVQTIPAAHFPHYSHMVQYHYPNHAQPLMGHMSPVPGATLPQSGIDQSSNTAPSTAQLSNVPPSNVIKPREKAPAILRNPTTKEVVPLDDLVVKEPTPSTNNDSSAGTTNATDKHIKANQSSTSPTSANNDNIKQSSTIAQKFSAQVAQVVRKDLESDGKNLINKNNSTVKTTIEVTSTTEDSHPPASSDKTDNVDPAKLDSNKVSDQATSETQVLPDSTTKISPTTLLDSKANATDTDIITRVSSQTDNIEDETKETPTDSCDKVDSGDTARVTDQQEPQISVESSKLETSGHNKETVNIEAKDELKEEAKEGTEIKVDNESSKEVKSDVENKAENEAKNIADVEESSKEKDEKSDDVAALLKPELIYEPDQYNPKTNLKGRRKYTCEFMRQILERLGLSTKPANHSHSAPVQQDLFAVSFGNQSRNYPSTRQIDPIRRQSQHAYPGRSSIGQEKQRKIISSVSLTQEVELRTTSSPWKPMKDATKEGVSDEELETIKLLKQFRGILNKLTPNNFDQLSKSVKVLPINTENRLEQVIGIVFEKAIAEPGFCVLYGRMCHLLKSDQVEGAAGGEAKFGHLLLKKCQERFNADVYAGLDIDARNKAISEETDPIAKKKMEEELYEDMYLCRLRGLGLQKFIGELYKINMLNDTIMLECILSLIRDATEESLECLCDLLKTIGKKLEDSMRATEHEAQQSKNSGKGKGASMASVVAGKDDKNLSNMEKFEYAFKQLQIYRKDKNNALSTRIRFRIQDTFDLRQQKWSPRRVENNPKLLEDIRREAIEEDHKNDMRSASRNSKPRGHLGPQSSSNYSLGLNNRNQPMNQESSKIHQEAIAKVFPMLINPQKPEQDHDTRFRPTNYWSKKPTSTSASGNSAPAPVAPKAADST